MIARFSPCDHERLAELLTDGPGTPRLQELTDHLEQCATCREHLEFLAGSGEDWATAREALSGSNLSTEFATPVGQPSRPDSSGEFGWIRSLLRPGDADELGRLGPYSIRGVIGQGGMGIVLRGWDAELNRPLAIKLLAPHLASSGAARQRFLREAQAAAAVVHPSVVPIYSVTADAAVPYLVMPLIAGGNLQQRVDHEGPLDLEECVRVALQIAEGLAAAHHQGLIHRDIKPANILLEEGGHRILISDFGLARALDDASVTASGVIAGTPPFMSPEQARGDAAEYRSDLFSLGSLIYAMATGRPPFRGDSALSIVRQISEQTPPSLREINERLPAWLDVLVASLMEREPERRPATADDVVRLLQGCLTHLRNPVTQPLPPELRRSLPGRPRPKNRLIAATTLAAAALVVAAWLSRPLLKNDGETRSVSPLNEPPAETGPAVATDEVPSMASPRSFAVPEISGRGPRPNRDPFLTFPPSPTKTVPGVSATPIGDEEMEEMNARIEWLQWQASLLKFQIESDLRSPESEETSDE